MNYAIYPYSDELYPILENKNELIDGIEISAVVYPLSWKKRILHTDALSGYVFGSDFRELINTADGVIFADITGRDFMYDDIIGKARYALSVGKDIIFCTAVKKADSEKLAAEFPERSITMMFENTVNYGADAYKHENIGCVAVGIGELYRGIDNVAAAVGVTAEFRKKGFKTALISVNKTLSIIGAYHFPVEIFRSGMDIEQMVGVLNAFFVGLERKSHCDVMVIQFPDGMLKFSPDIADSYGIKAFMTTRAVAIDYFVLVSTLEIIHQEAYERLKLIFEKRYGISLDSCLIKKVMIDRAYSVEVNYIQYTRNRINDNEALYAELKKEMNDIIISELDDRNIFGLIADDCVKKLS